MGKTMQEEWPAEWPISACEWADQREETIENLHGDIDRLRTRLSAYERDLIDDDTGKDRSQDTDWLRRGFLQRGAEIERLETIVEQYERAIIQRDDSVPKWAKTWRKDEGGSCVFVGSTVWAEPAPDLRPEELGPITLPIVDL